MLNAVAWTVGVIFTVASVITMMFTLRDNFVLALSLFQAGGNMVPNEPFAVYAQGWLLERIK